MVSFLALHEANAGGLTSTRARRNAARVKSSDRPAPWVSDSNWLADLWSGSRYGVSPTAIGQPLYKNRSLIRNAFANHWKASTSSEMAGLPDASSSCTHTAATRRSSPERDGRKPSLILTDWMERRQAGRIDHCNAGSASAAN